MKHWGYEWPLGTVILNILRFLGEWIRLLWKLDEEKWLTTTVVWTFGGFLWFFVPSVVLTNGYMTFGLWSLPFFLMSAWGFPWVLAIAGIILATIGWLLWRFIKLCIPQKLDDAI